MKTGLSDNLKLRRGFLGVSLPAALLCLLFLMAAARTSPAAGVSSEILSHQSSGAAVEFTLSAPPSRVWLQGLNEKTGRWKTLATRVRPTQDLSRLVVPPKWRNSNLRVVAAYPAQRGKRTEILSQVDQDTRSVVFTSTANARLFSVEAKSPGASAWSRVSTVAAPDSPRAIRVALPSVVSSDARVRVMEVSGSRQLYPPLKTPLAPWMRGGPAVYGLDVPVMSLGAGANAADGGPNFTAERPEESDIWKIRGQKIYFFNRLRGLQIIDVADATDPRVIGSLSMAGAGEEMYLLGSEAASSTGAILVTSLPWSASKPEATRLHNISLAGDNPVSRTNLDLPGYYIDSRLIGGLLHVVTATWTSEIGSWEPQTIVTSIDISQGGVMVQVSQKTLAVSGSQVGSTGKYLWVAGQSGDDWTRHTLFAFPFGTAGALGEPLQTGLGGRVMDKFKVGDTAAGLAVVVQDFASPQQATSVETFREEGGALLPHGQLDLVRGESLFATRYQGDRLYVVTFEQIDPLWIVDLSDPAAPAVKGHLEVPGYSTFIQPVGDVLLAVGRDGGKVQVSMFDVSDESNPRLADRVDVGDGWSWSEAEWNEKAVKILPGAGLILLPVAEFAGATRSDRVGLVDFDVTRRDLALRGTIRHDFAPRRAALLDGALIASVSNRELLLVDASDRDNPAVTADVALAFGADRIIARGDTAIMFENGGNSWSGSPRDAVLRTAPVSDLDNVLAEISLPASTVAAAEIIHDRLVVVETGGVSGPVVADHSPSSVSQLSVWSLADAARPALVGRVALPFDFGFGATILPAQDGRVAVVSGSDGDRWAYPFPVLFARSSPALSSDAALPWRGRWWRSRDIQLAVARVSGDAPSIEGNWNLPDGDYASVSQVFSAGDLLAFSYDRFESSPKEVALGTKTWLQIVDLADPAEPMPWAPVQLPGELAGISWLQRAGGVLFARSGGRVAALAFDGENAPVVAEVEAGSAVAFQGSTLYALTENGVEEWHFSETGARWTKGSGWTFDTSTGASSLHVFDGALLAGGHEQAWVLRENGSFATVSYPGGSDLGRSDQTGNFLLVPAGEYGAFRLSLMP